jgi:anti-anti-sigma factor
MKNQVREVSGVRIIELQGNLVMGKDEVQIRETVKALVQEGAKKVLINMSGVKKIDSTGVGELMGCHHSMRLGGGELRLCALSDRIRDVLTISQLITVFKIYDDEKTGIESFAA